MPGRGGGEREDASDNHSQPATTVNPLHTASHSPPASAFTTMSHRVRWINTLVRSSTCPPCDACAASRSNRRRIRSRRRALAALCVTDASMSVTSCSNDTASISSISPSTTSTSTAGQLEHNAASGALTWHTMQSDRMVPSRPRRSTARHFSVRSFPWGTTHVHLEQSLDKQACWRTQNPAPTEVCAGVVAASASSSESLDDESAPVMSWNTANSDAAALELAAPLLSGSAAASKKTLFSTRALDQPHERTYFSRATEWKTQA